MKRRSALKKISSGLSAGLLLPTLPGILSSCEPVDPGPAIPYDGSVAIIGAGASGLYAADLLRNKGIAVNVYEASDRVGGRIHSLRATGETSVETDFPIELGAERILGTGSLWHEIVSQGNIPLVDLSGAGSNFFIVEGAFRPAGELVDDADFADAQAFFERLRERPRASASVQDVLEDAGIPARMHPILNALIGNRYGADNTRLGISGLVEALQMLQRDAREFVLQSNRMQDVLASRFSAVVEEVQFNTVITDIDYTGSKVVLSGTRNGEAFSVEADKVIVAVPVSILKDDIAFSPALPESKANALSSIEMGPAVRIVLDFKQNFWSKDATFVLGHPQVPEMLTTGQGRSDHNKTLGITAFGESAEMLSSLGTEAPSFALTALDDIFDGAATLNIRRNDDQSIIYEMVDWTTVPYIKGGISYLPPGAGYDNHVRLAEPVGSALFFAGEATDVSGDAGTINGALTAAERAAAEVIASITG